MKQLSGKNIKRLKTGIIIIYFLIFIFIFLIVTKNLTGYAYGIKGLKNPFKTIKDLYSFAKLSKDTILKTQILERTLSLFVLPLMFYLCFGLFIFAYIKRKKLIKKNDERQTLRGSAKWANINTLKKSDYAFSWDAALNPKTDEGTKKLHVILGQSADAEIDSSTPQYLVTDKFGSLAIGCDITKFNTLTIGGIGSGKGAGTICPTLLTFPDSVICYDPSKENFNKTAGFRQSLGNVQYFDPSDPTCNLHFNPFDWIRRTPAYITADIANIAQIVVPDDPSSNDKYWSQSARNFFIILTSYVLLFLPKENQNIKSILELSNIASYNDDPFFIENMYKRRLSIEESMKNLSPDNLEYKSLACELTFIKNEIRNLEMTDDGQPSNALKRHLDAHERKVKEKEDLLCLVWKVNRDAEYKLKTIYPCSENEWRITLLKFLITSSKNFEMGGQSEKTISTVFSFLDAELSFFSEELIANLMKDTSFTAESLMMNKNPLSLYLCIKNADTQRCKKFVQLFISCVISKLTDDYTKKNTHHLLFILDEFPQLGYIESVKNALPFVRKYHISFMLIVQSLAQLESKDAYGKEETRAIIDNVRVIDIKQVSDTETAKWVSEKLGKQTIIMDLGSSSYKTGSIKKESVGQSEHIEGRPLMNEQEIISMDPGEELLLITNMGGARVKKLQYFEHPELSKRSAIPYKAKSKHKRNRSRIVKNMNNDTQTAIQDKEIDLNSFA